MKRILLVLFFHSTLFAMQEVEVGLPVQMMDLRENKPHSCCANSFGKVGIKRPKPTMAESLVWVMRVARCEPDTFSEFLCSKEQTGDLDDEETVITIHKDLLKRMLLYVYYTNNSSREDASDVLSKISKKDFELNQIAVTKKDWYYRLLSHIPWTGQRDHNSCYPVRIQNKVIFLKMKGNSCIHKQTHIEPCQEHVVLATPLTDGDQISQEFNKLVALTKIG